MESLVGGCMWQRLCVSWWIRKQSEIRTRSRATAFKGQFLVNGPTASPNRKTVREQAFETLASGEHFRFKPYHPHSEEKKNVIEELTFRF